MQLLKAVLVVIFLLLASIEPSAAAPSSSDANQFWQVFRVAVVTNKIEKVVSLTHFPFEVRGEVDSDPTRHYDKKTFPKIFKRLINQVEFVPSAGRTIQKSMLQIVEEKKTLTPRDYLVADVIRIQDFEFRLIEGHWLFTKAYLGE